jgi:hypothetical protein
LLSLDFLDSLFGLASSFLSDFSEDPFEDDEEEEADFLA